jgi:hypothetical protein
VPVLVGLLGRVAPDPAAVGFARAAVRGPGWLAEILYDALMMRRALHLLATAPQ